ncbi:hypothetical protein L226DRAFT_241528 [Lentinus tigrinus ALCF2SS1-7]|uniref:Uncharacterized protein n=1 Tax=Lentinus tigrinus ALCF2SS1-6 TaxID=1328759 RepID=A0A5C2SQ38_9APHY|nr:hypothetical protein L227DRAFT_212450 [Lentinus tigrinus ALCF2SS1-6]RPD79134.1 hypothetical protein L226DRAFT_241528 [Lentinus tigrinus ALCF2SS1-7]
MFVDAAAPPPASRHTRSSILPACELSSLLSRLGACLTPYPGRSLAALSSPTSHLPFWPLLNAPYSMYYCPQPRPLALLCDSDAPRRPYTPGVQASPHVRARSPSLPVRLTFISHFYISLHCFADDSEMSEADEAHARLPIPFIREQACRTDLGTQSTIHLDSRPSRPRVFVLHSECDPVIHPQSIHRPSRSCIR